MKIYTRKGDKGKTALLGGSIVSKANLRLEAYGTVDELNASIGLVRANLDKKLFDSVDAELKNIQNMLFNIGSHLACPSPARRRKLPHLNESEVKVLENSIDEFTLKLPPLTQFILPGGHPVAAQLHMTRTICRRAERNVTRIKSPFAILYLNRLGDYCFVLARHINHNYGIAEIAWSKPNSPLSS